MLLLDALTAFRQSIQDANALISLAFQQDAAGNYTLPPVQGEAITNAGFLQGFIAWEAYLENSFISYMLGEHSMHGIVITRFSQPKDEKHARSMLVGTQKYVDWANPEIVRTLSNLHFEIGGPHYTQISAINQELLDLRTIRNFAAHLTSLTGPKLDGVGRRLLRRPCIDMKVSDLIFAVDPSSTTADTILTVYQNKLDICAECIANG